MVYIVLFSLGVSVGVFLLWWLEMYVVCGWLIVLRLFSNLLCIDVGLI